MRTVYLDHNATTPTRPEVIEAMARVYAAGLGNPASQHSVGQQARRLLEDARESIASLLGAVLAPPRRDRLIFTSGGTEANNMAVLGICRAERDGAAGHLIVSAMEHPSVLGPAEHLLERGWRLDTLGVTADGVVRTGDLAGLLRPETSLVSVMMGNHDTGVLQPVHDLASICRTRGVPFHTDAVQVAGKQAVGFHDLGVSAMSVAAHKFRGPLGIGALVVESGVAIEPLLRGGHQQGGLRGGTESVALAVGMQTALELWAAEQDQHAQHLSCLRQRLEDGLRAGYPALVVNAAQSPRLPQTANVAFPGIDGQVLLMALDLAGIACSVGSACSSGSTELSPTLRAMGLPAAIVGSSLRFSVGATTTVDDIDEAVGRILHVVGELG